MKQHLQRCLNVRTRVVVVLRPQRPLWQRQGRTNDSRYIIGYVIGYVIGSVIGYVIGYKKRGSDTHFTRV